ncbi:hypothetical protein H0H93_005448 [Arthromyces matolae]|nr:hypothetical protein H0H93_005448 [Arthromyces matolae]
MYSVSRAGAKYNELAILFHELFRGDIIHTDPTNWNDERFNLEQAIELHNQGKPDVVVSASTPKKSSKVGPIVGGVVGGIAVILLAAGVAFYLQRRKKQSRDDYATNKVAHSNGDGPGHARTVSDLSTKSNLIGFGYQQLDRSFATSPSSPPPMSVTSGTMHTHTGSVNSLSYFGSVSHSVSPYGAASPPPTIARTLSPSISPPPVPSLPTQPQAALNREDIIVPFTLPPSDTNSSSHGHPTDRKRADGAIIPVFDPPNSFPVAVAPATESGETSASGSRPRVNPPAYSVVDQASIAPSRSHAKKGSGDTQFSIDSATSGVQPSVIQRHGHGAGGGSISAIDDVIGHMGFGSPTDSVSAGGTLGTGLSGQYNQPTFRRVVGNPDP